MNEIGDRILEVIKSNGITQTEFADKLNISQAFVSKIIRMIAVPSDRTIKDICREFNVNETWLRTGEGEMEEPVTEDDRIAKLFGDVLKGKPDIRRRLISALARLDPEDWDLIEKMIEKVSGDEEKPAP